MVTTFMVEQNGTTEHCIFSNNVKYILVGWLDVTVLRVHSSCICTEGWIAFPTSMHTDCE